MVFPTVLPRYPAKCLFLDRFYFRAVLLSLWLSRTWENGWGTQQDKNTQEKGDADHIYTWEQGERVGNKQESGKKMGQVTPEGRNMWHEMRGELGDTNLTRVLHMQCRERNTLQNETQSFILDFRSSTHLSIFCRGGAEHAGALRGTSHWRPTW